MFPCKKAFTEPNFCFNRCAKRPWYWTCFRVRADDKSREVTKQVLKQTHGSGGRTLSKEQPCDESAVCGRNNYTSHTFENSVQIYCHCQELCRLTDSLGSRKVPWTGTKNCSKSGFLYSFYSGIDWAVCTCGNVLQRLQDGSPGRGDELRKISHQKILFLSWRKNSSKKTYEKYFLNISEKMNFEKWKFQFFVKNYFSKKCFS